MRALTLHQPYASFIALGVKHIETRSFKTNYRGPLAIHAGKRRPKQIWCDADEGTPELVFPLFDSYEQNPCWEWMENVHDYTQQGYRWIGPLGVVVATANLVACVPMYPLQKALTTAWEPHLAPYTGSNDWTFWKGPNQHLGRGWEIEPVQDQVPYGHFEPGRFAWLLEDVTPIDPVPAKGQLGLWNWEPAS